MSGSFPKIPVGLKENYHTAITWEVPVEGQVHKINFLHTFHNGKFQMDMDGKDTIEWKPQKSWFSLFRSGGSLNKTFHKRRFNFGTLHLEVLIFVVDEDYIYALNVNGIRFKTYKKEHYKRFNTWCMEIDKKKWRVVLDTEDMKVWVNGSMVEKSMMSFNKSSAGFLIDGTSKCRIEHTGDKETGYSYSLFLDDVLIPPYVSLEEPIFRSFDEWLTELQKAGLM